MEKVILNDALEANKQTLLGLVGMDIVQQIIKPESSVSFSDLNEFKEVFCFAQCRGMLNAPDGKVWGVLCVKTTRTDGYYTQIAITNNQNLIRIRHCVNGVWGTWGTIE